MELLAPAGNFQSLKAAVACKADAVYLGLEKYGARAGACNFSVDTLASAVEFAHLRGVKIYLTVNTLLKDNEMQDALSTVSLAVQAGVDAFIVQDLGLISEIKRKLPNAILHASTQMGISNAYGAAYVKSLGLTRVVLARETLPRDIEKIKRETGLETEVFCHGALCVAYSGNCYYSSLVSGCSGNRGRCLQLCRKKYAVGQSDGYYLSAKDICLVKEVEQLKKLGVDSLKIEGRMRSPEYVAETVSVYRKAIDGGNVTDEDVNRLKKVFNRGDYCRAYFVAPTENVIYDKVQNNIGLYVGKVKSVKGGKAVLDTFENLEIGDGVKYVRNGFEIGGGFVDGVGSTGYRGNVKAGDEVRLTGSVSLKKAVAELKTELPVKVSVTLDTANGASITISHNDNKVTVNGSVPVQIAANKAVSKSDIGRVVGSLGGTDFTVESLAVNLENNVFYPMSAVKEMRKRAVADLRAVLLAQYAESAVGKSGNYAPTKTEWLLPKKESIFVVVKSARALNKVKFHYDYVIFNPDDFGDYKALKYECELFGDKKVLLDLPFVVRGEDVDVLIALRDLPVCGFVANNLCQLEIFKGKYILGGIGLNKLNSYFDGTFVNSIESDCMGSGINYIYGKPPYMNLTHCPNKVHGGNCRDCNGYKITMKDDKGALTEIHRVKLKYCYGVVVPRVPLNNFSAVGNHYGIIDLTFATDNEVAAVNEQLIGKKPYALECTHGNINRKLQ